MNDRHIQAMWIYFLLAPSKPRPEADGSFYIGDVGEAPEKTWTKATPYSPAQSEPS